MGPKDKAKDNEITKKKKDEEKEFTGKDMPIEGTKEAASKTPNPEPSPDKPLTIGDILPGLRAKGMKI